MNEIGSVIENFDNWAHHRHHGQQAPDHAIPAIQTIPATQTAPTTQESHVSKLQDAQNVIADAAGNPLIVAIAEAGIGLACGPQEVTVVLNVIRAIENGPGAHQQATAAAADVDQAEQHTAQPATATFTANPLAQQPA